MSSPSRRSNDHSAIRGSGRSSNSVGRSSSQPPQPFQPPATISGTHGGTANSVPWVNRPPSNVQGTAPGQAPAAALYANHTPSVGDWDYMLDVSQLIDSAQLQPQQQQITVPELYPTFPTSTSTTRGQYENPQSRDRLQQSTWSGVSHLPPSRVSVQPASQPPQDVLYNTQPLYRQTPNRESQNYPSQRQQQQSSSSPPRPRINQNLDSNQISPLSPPVVSPNPSQVGTPYTSQYNSPTSSSTRTRSSDYDIGRQRPPPSPNRQEVSLRPTHPGEGEGDRWGLHSVGALSSSVPIAPRPSIPQPAVSNIVRQPPPRLPPQAPAPVPRLPSVPTCLIPGCREPVVKDLRTNELTEYCGETHMSEALQRHGVRVCPACKKFPRRTGSEYCGTSCERWAAEQRERQQQRPPLQQQRQGQPLQQQQRQHSQQRQGQQQQQQQQQLLQQQQHQRQVQQPQQLQHQRQGQQQPQQQPQQQGQGQPRDQQQPSAANPYPVTWTNVAGGPTSSNTSLHDRQGQFNWTN